MKRYAFAAVAAAAVLGSMAAAPANARQAPAAEAAALPALSEEFAVMRDGVKLAANVFKPAGRGPWPVVMSRTPYLKDGRETTTREQLAQAARRYTDAGYVYVVQDVRGKGRSEGVYAPFENDVADGYDSVEWAAAQSWSNGKVGLTGASALGITANLAAMSNPPSLVAAYVIVAPFDRREYAYPGGVLKEEDVIGWSRRQGVDQETLDKSRGRGADDMFWAMNAMSTGRKYIDIPIYNVGGWYDIFNGGSVDNFVWLQNHGAEGARGNQKLLMGPFGHGDLSGDLAYPGEDRLALRGGEEIAWFDHWLKGEDNGIMDAPPVRYFMMASARTGAPSAKNRWMREANWPPAHRETRWYLHGDRTLSQAEPAADGGRTTYRFDPARPVPTVGGANLTFERGPMDQRAIPARPDYLRFQTPVLAEDVAIAGPVKVELWAATDAPDTDFHAKLVDVYPDGYEAIVLDAPIRASYRGGSSPDAIRPMEPGAPVELVIDLWPTAITFEKGHRIALHVTSSNAPRFEVNPNTGETPGKGALKPRVATNVILHDAAHPSALVLPVIYPDDLAEAGQ